MNNQPSNFDYKDYINNNTYGIKRFEQHLKNNGFSIIKGSQNVEDYKIDIIAAYNKKAYFFEIEVDNTTTFTSAEDFPYKNVSFLARKKKMTKNSFYYIRICRKTDHFYFAKSDKIFNKDFETNDMVKKNRTEGVDNFYRLPKNNVTFKKLYL
jgi:hypothetical protein